MGNSVAATLTVAEIAARCAGVASSLPIKALCLFGSYADGTAGPDSSVDLACDFSDGYQPGISFLRWDERFSDALGKSVDLLTVESIQGSASSYLRSSFDANAVKVYVHE